MLQVFKIILVLLSIALLSMAHADETANTQSRLECISNPIVNAAQFDVCFADGIWQKVANKRGIDPLLLYSVSLKESRKLWPDGMVRPWPWLLNGPDGAVKFDSYEEALNALRNYLNRGYRNIDVGPMQVNIRHNGARVASYEDLLIIETNLSIGADILTESLASSPNDISLGIGRYFAGYRAERAEDARQYGTSVIEMYHRIKHYLDGI